VTAPLKHASTFLVAQAWLRQCVEGLSGIVASSLPKADTWALTGFVTCGPQFGGVPEMYVPLRRPVIQVDCWAIFPNQTKKRNDGLANDLAERVVNASYEWTGDPVDVTLPPGVKPVHLSMIYPVSEVRWVPDPDPGMAHYAVDMHVGWIEQGAIAGAAG
jgi:hypothetical protein